MRRGLRAAREFMDMPIDTDSNHALPAVRCRSRRRVLVTYGSTTLIRCFGGRHRLVAMKGADSMFRHGNARRAALLLMVLAVAFLWTADQGIRAAASDRAEKSAIPAKAATPAVTDTTATAPPPAKADTPATTAAEPAPRDAGRCGAAGWQSQGQGHPGPGVRREVQADRAGRTEEGGAMAAKRGLKPGIAGCHARTLLRNSRHLSQGDAALFRSLRQLGVQPAPEGSCRDRHGSGTRGTGYTAAAITVDDAYLPARCLTRRNG